MKLNQEQTEKIVYGLIALLMKEKQFSIVRLKQRSELTAKGKVIEYNYLQGVNASLNSVGFEMPAAIGMCCMAGRSILTAYRSWEK